MLSLFVCKKKRRKRAEENEGEKERERKRSQRRNKLSPTDFSQHTNNHDAILDVMYVQRLYNESSLRKLDTISMRKNRNRKKEKYNERGEKTMMLNKKNL